jgi:hypothetical protein
MILGALLRCSSVVYGGIGCADQRRQGEHHVPDGDARGRLLHLSPEPGCRGSGLGPSSSTSFAEIGFE